ncbi:protein TIC 55, chloroplastic [Cocos nucifera]|uniref:Protein TIC 55, chloroplastic n=1 Tax=Cocos nucifera TaxID=13894 RepID=A0A8K0HUA0_COCNU|nr:protein TIC 55, chloroplastic [Cocos nucifera]
MALFHLSSLCLLSFRKALDSSSPVLPCKPTSIYPISTTDATTTFGSCNIYRTRKIPRRRRRLGECWAAVVEDVDKEVLLAAGTEEQQEEEAAEEYDWREEWYPLYLAVEVPDDAPLGLTVFHKQVVLYREGGGVLRCYEDRCPHRLAKLSEGQLVDGRLECLYHGWQFEGDGKCVKIPQLPEGGKIPQRACAKTYEVRESQGVVWIWMSEKNPPNVDKLPWFEHYDRPGFQDLSTIHELPYDHSILLENLMDPAHVPISHDRTDWTAKREDAQPLVFNVTERTNRGFAGQWGRSKNPALMNFLRFQAPCVLSNSLELVDKKGERQYFSALFLCRPSGQGKSMLIVRFGASARSVLAKLVPKWYFHQNACKVFEQDMGFLSSQNEVLMKENVPTKELYLNLKSSDAWVAEYRKWMDKVGHGMPYYFGHKSISLPEEPAVVEHAPAGLVAGISASFPAKGGVGTQHAPNPANRYYRHVVHCRGCRSVVKAFQAWKNALLLLTLAAVAAAILAAARKWKFIALASAALFFACSYACSSAVSLITTNFIRTHRRL